MVASALLMPRAPNVSTCSTPACIKTAQDILADIDLNIDPCSDFYQYTCGSWLKNQVLPENEPSNGTLDALRDNVNKDMRIILEGTYDDIYKNVSGSEEGFNTDDVKNDKHNFETMQNYYNLCMNESTINSLGPTPIYEDIANIENKLFPVNDTSATLPNANATDFLTQTITLLQRNQIMALTTLFTNADEKNPAINVISLSQPQLSFPSKEYYSKEESVQVLRTGLNDLLYKVLGGYSNGTSDADIRASESNRTGFQRWSEDKIKSSVDRFIDFEAKLANIYPSPAEIQNRLLAYNPTVLSTFQNENPMIDWTSIINTLIPDNGIKSGPNTTLIVRVPSYYKQLNGLLSSNVTLQTLQEYFIINFVVYKAQYLDETSATAVKAFSAQSSSASSSDSSSTASAAEGRWFFCATSTSALYKNSIARYYVLKKFGGEAERKELDSFITTIHDQWIHKLQYNDWLDEQTKAAAIEKVKLISQQAAYGTSSPDIRNPASIKEDNQGLAVNKTSFYDSYTIAIHHTTSKIWEVAGEKTDKNKWLMAPQAVNAYYDVSTNQIVVPVGIAQSPLYTFGDPEYLNYGGVGVVIGHEITHAFDKNGKEFDGRGVLTDWWTNATNMAFDERSKCFIEQYSKFTVTAGNKTLNVNGEMTLSENIADNGGLSASYLAYQTLQGNKKTSERLSGLDQLSPEALFFVNFGRVFCRKQSDAMAEITVLTNMHSPAQARVNGAIQNNDDFATVFSCPVGSPMNPEKKCKIW